MTGGRLRFSCVSRKTLAPAWNILGSAVVSNDTAAGCATPRSLQMDAREQVGDARIFAYRVPFAHIRHPDVVHARTPWLVHVHYDSRPP